VLDLSANKGTATFSGGTGKLMGFEAQADVTADSDGVALDWDIQLRLTSGLLRLAFREPAGSRALA